MLKRVKRDLEYSVDVPSVVKREVSAQESEDMASLIRIKRDGDLDGAQEHSKRDKRDLEVELDRVKRDDGGLVRVKRHHAESNPNDLQRVKRNKRETDKQKSETTDKPTVKTPEGTNKTKDEKDAKVSPPVHSGHKVTGRKGVNEKEKKTTDTHAHKHHISKRNKVKQQKRAKHPNHQDHPAKKRTVEHKLHAHLHSKQHTKRAPQSHHNVERAVKLRLHKKHHDDEHDHARAIMRMKRLRREINGDLNRELHKLHKLKDHKDMRTKRHASHHRKAV